MSGYDFLAGFVAGALAAGILFTLTAGVMVRAAWTLLQRRATKLTPPSPPGGAVTVLPGRAFEPAAPPRAASPWEMFGALPGEKAILSYGPFRVSGFGTMNYVEVMIIGLIGGRVKVRGCDPPHHIGDVNVMQFHPDDRSEAMQTCAKIPKGPYNPEVVVDSD
jgi:hypothetical protein